MINPWEDFMVVIKMLLILGTCTIGVFILLMTWVLIRASGIQSEEERRSGLLGNNYVAECHAEES